MALFRLNIDQVLRLLEVSGKVTATWPMARGIRGFERFLRNCYFVFSVVNMMVLAIPFGLFAYHAPEAILAIKGLSEMFTIVEATFVIILSRLANDKLQDLWVKTKEFVSAAENHERRILQKYIDRYLNFYSTVAFAYLLCATSFSVIPLVQGLDFLGDVWFPFPTDNVILKRMIYILQVFGTYQAAIALCVAFLTSLFIWIPAARLEMLSIKLADVEEVGDLISCIKEHQEIIGYVDEAQEAVHVLIFKTNITMTLICICAAFPLLHKQSLELAMQFCSLLMAALENLFIVCWPAQDLIEIHHKVAESFYSVQWVGKTKNMGKIVQIALLRSRKPLTFRVVLFPSPSFEYYASYLKTLSSYFMGIRTAIGAD